MSKVELCPVCQGSGKRYELSFFQLRPEECSATTCHGCDGRGWVQIFEEPQPQRIEPRASGGNELGLTTTGSGKLPPALLPGLMWLGIWMGCSSPPEPGIQPPPSAWSYEELESGQLEKP